MPPLDMLIGLPLTMSRFDSTTLVCVIVQFVPQLMPLARPLIVDAVTLALIRASLFSQTVTPEASPPAPALALTLPSSSTLVTSWTSTPFAVPRSPVCALMLAPCSSTWVAPAT
jgi:hypothetical protein